LQISFKARCSAKAVIETDSMVRRQCGGLPSSKMSSRLAIASEVSERAAAHRGGHCYVQFKHCCRSISLAFCCAGVRCEHTLFWKIFTAQFFGIRTVCFRADNDLPQCYCTARLPIIFIVPNLNVATTPTPHVAASIACLDHEESILGLIRP